MHSRGRSHPHLPTRHNCQALLSFPFLSFPFSTRERSPSLPCPNLPPSLRSSVCPSPDQALFYISTCIYACVIRAALLDAHGKRRTIHALLIREYHHISITTVSPLSSAHSFKYHSHHFPSAAAVQATSLHQELCSLP